MFSERGELENGDGGTIELLKRRVRRLHDDLVNADGLEACEGFTHRFRGGDDALRTADGDLFAEPRVVVELVGARLLEGGVVA